MAKFNEGFENIKVTLIDWPGEDLVKKVYEFGRLSHDFIDELPKCYEMLNDDCTKLIDKIIEGTTLPKFALQGVRLNFRIENISRICLAQLTRDNAIFASASTGVFPLTQEFNIPLSIYRNKSIMSKLEKAQEILEDAYIEAIENEIPTIEARYIGLHPQVISLTASYTPADFVRSCHSRTSSNFCDECNYVYRLMYLALDNEICKLTDENNLKLCNWLFKEEKCINDQLYKRERLYNSDFIPVAGYKPDKPALNDWRKSGWKMELERMYTKGTGFITNKEFSIIGDWMKRERLGEELPTTYDNSQRDVAVNAIKDMDYYRRNKNER